MINVEKNERCAIINLAEKVLDSETAQDIEKKVVGLYREGYTSFILNFNELSEMDTDGLRLIKKVYKVVNAEQGLLAITTENESLIEELDDLKLDELVIMSTVEEAKEAIYLHELENDFKQEDAEEDEEYGEEGSYNDYE